MNNLFKFNFVILFVIIKLVKSSPPQCGLYGMQPCQFVPAPPGSTPSCAQPGKTYCEHAPHYPIHVIKHLIHKWGYDINSILADETVEDFNSVGGYRNPVTIPQFYGPPQSTYGPPNTNQIYSTSEGYKYGPPPARHVNSNNNNYGGIYNEEYPEPIYIPRPSNNHPSFQPQQQQQFSAATGYHQTAQTNNYNYYNAPQVTRYNPVENFKRYVREISKKSDTNASDLDEVKSRTKRQSPGRSSLCQTRSSFIQPQAALSSKGNWMYVVNQVETASQLVKTETCASSVCSNLCQLPNGYSSRCEQKYVQKRLVALDGNGQRLYTDTFWFPSCCVCTISN